MNQFRVIGLLLLLAGFGVEGQSVLGNGYGPSEDEAETNFQPSLAVVIGVLSIMFALTFILLVYAKFCHRGASVHGDHQQDLPGMLNRSRSQLSGIDKTVIESLPFFRFSSLKGSKQGLECAVCLSRFEDVEILRLLPKCKHAFHIGCIDQWLEKHSSCPLCRHKVSAEDPAIFAYSNSMRFLNQSSDLCEDSNMELYVEREEENHGSSRFSIGSSFRKILKGNKEEEGLLQEEAGACDDAEQKTLHKFKHKIIVPDVVFKNRWSSVSSSDLMFLNSEMLNAMSSERFSSIEANDGLFLTRTNENEEIMKIKAEMEMKRLFESKIISKTNTVSIAGDPSSSGSLADSSNNTSRIIHPAERRSMSEITAFSRFRDFTAKGKTREPSLSGTNTKEERIRRLWLPIARRTIQWFANRERRSQQSHSSTQHLDV